MHDLSQKREIGSLHDSRFMLAEAKRKVLKQWEAFLKSGYAREKFTKPLYEHLIQHCSFIAHYDINGFYATYFESGDDTAHFLSQFDGSNGIPKSIEYGMTYWFTDPDYHDINSEMVRIAGKYIPVLVRQAKAQQRHNDIQVAKTLLAKHGITLPEVE